MPLILASRNRKKSEELAQLLAAHGIDLISVGTLPGVPEIEETGETFRENARLKAVGVAVAAKEWAIADDSGLAVDALGGRPGVYSARYSGPHATDATNNELLLKELENTPPEKRGAEYVCCLAVSDPQGVVQLEVEDRCRGVIIRQLHGKNGFGYDPLFLIPEYHLTFGELSPAVKEMLSHRARALRKLIAPLCQLLAK